MKLRIGTRESRLAMAQTEVVRDAIRAGFPEAEIILVPMSTKGDRMLDRSLDSFGGKGVFTKELEDALLCGRIDLAVHSAKDMPMELPEGLAMGAVLSREEPADVLLTRHGIRAGALPPGSVIGTGSLRRQLQIRAMNPQVTTAMLRGNVPTRIRKLLTGEYDGIVLAAAGLKRLGLLEEDGSLCVERALALAFPESGLCGKAGQLHCSLERQGTQSSGLYMEYLDKERFVPAAGQGILAVEIRQGELAEVMEQIHSPETAAELSAERRFLEVLGGSCNAPCGAWCRKSGEIMEMTVMYARDGVHPVCQKKERLLAGMPAGEKKRQECLRAQALELAEELAACVRAVPVCLVGAGPGDAGLITAKGLACVRRADVIVYDNLISGSILNEARLDAELIYAGKRAGSHAMSQEDINELLVRSAMEGKAVTRLKGGDPFVFGRGGEEAMALAAHGIPYEIVPGVSSAYSVPAYAGIPVTHRGLASSFHVITGREGAGKAEESVDYRVLAKEEGTLLFLMGLSRIGEIADRLMEGGKAAATPVAVIESGTTAAQRVLRSDLEHVAADVLEKGIRTPAVTVVGAVAKLQEVLSWFGKAPLAGIRVLATGTRHYCHEMEEELWPYGAETVAVSLIESRPIRTGQIREAFTELSRYQWMVFTSGNGVDLFFETLKEQRIDLRQMMHLKFAAIGRKTAGALAKHGFVCDFVPEHFSGADLAREWVPTLARGERVILMRAKEGSSVLPRALEEAGIEYADIALYETWVDARRREELNRLIRQVDYVTVASASAARALASMLDEPDRMTAKLVSIGPSTSEAVRAAGLAVRAEAGEYTVAGIAAVILADARGEGSGERTETGPAETAMAPVSVTASPVSAVALPVSAAASPVSAATAPVSQAPAFASSAEEVVSPAAGHWLARSSAETEASGEPVHAQTGENHGYFPVFVDLTGKRILIVGAGTVASRRAAILAGFGADLLVKAPAGTEQMANLEADGRVRWIRQSFEESDLNGAAMVLAATDDACLNERIVRLCRERGIPVNDAGEKERCDFYFPAIARKGNVVAGLTASGTDHRLAGRLAAELREWMQEQSD